LVDGTLVSRFRPPRLDADECRADITVAAAQLNFKTVSGETLKNAPPNRFEAARYYKPGRAAKTRRKRPVLLRTR
jgi:hypothetical protein